MFTSLSSMKTYHPNVVQENSPDTAPSNSAESSPTQQFRHREMVSKMLTTAQLHGRNFVDDAIRLITVYVTRRTNDLTRIVEGWAEANPHRQSFETMVNIYDIRSQANYLELHATLSRITEALPQMSLVMHETIAYNPSVPKPWLSNKELGTVVPRHFKVNYYPGLMEMQVAGLKAKAGLLLWNLCFAKVLMKTSKGRMNPIQSFIVSCHHASNLMSQQLAPSQSRKRFTEYVESLPLTAHTMDEMWKTVLDETTINSSPSLCLTSFHQSVFSAQPLDLAKWQQLLMESDK